MTEYINRRTGEIVELHKGKLLTPDGAEIPDSTPLAPPVGYERQPSLAEQIRAMIVGEKLRAEVEAAGAETFEEADDFDVGDDYDPTSPYEANFDPMTPEERAALNSGGRDVDGILGKDFQPEVPQKPKKQSGRATSTPPVSELGEDHSEDE